MQRHPRTHQTIIEKCWPRIAFCMISAVLALSGHPASATSEPTRATCDAALANGQKAAEKLPKGSMARRFADTDLVLAKAEGGNGEFDDCEELAAKAQDEADHPHHSLVPVSGNGAEPITPPGHRPKF